MKKFDKMKEEVSYDFLIRYIVNQMDKMTATQLEALAMQASFELEDRLRNRKES